MVFWMRVESEWAKQVSNNLESEECNAWIRVLVKELAGTSIVVSDAFVFRRLEEVGSESESLASTILEGC